MTMQRTLKAGLVVLAFVSMPLLALAEQITLVHTITGEPLDMKRAQPEGRDTPAVKQFMQTGVNPYTEVKACLPKGEEIFLTACSGCHGHHAEGKLGPGLADDYWTYPKNKTDKGLFETIYGGAQGMMGPHWDLQLNEILLLMAWIRHLYHGPIEEAAWLTDEQKKNFTPFDPENPKKISAEGACEIPAQ